MASSIFFYYFLSGKYLDSLVKLLPGFYAVSQYMSKRITHSQKTLFPTTQAYGVVRKQLSTAISRLYTTYIIGIKGGTSLKKGHYAP
jgi:hypothetical protein